jgi:hypothetical protein
VSPREFFDGLHAARERTREATIAGDEHEVESFRDKDELGVCRRRSPSPVALRLVQELLVDGLKIGEPRLDTPNELDFL